MGGTLLNTTRLALQLADYLVSVGHLPSRPEPSRFPTRVCREKQVAVSKLDLASAEDAQRPGLIHLITGLFFRVRLANVSALLTQRAFKPFSLPAAPKSLDG